MNHILPKAHLATALMLVLNLGIAGAKVSGSSNETTIGTLTKGYVYSFTTSEEKARECKSCLKGRTSNVDTAAMGAKPVYVFDVVDGKPGFYKFSGILKAEKAYYQEEDN